MGKFWVSASSFLWGSFGVLLLVGTGIYLTIWLKGSHWRRFGLGWKFALQGTAARERAQSGGSLPPGEISPWQSMMTMLAGAIGNGNIAGVATAIATGGPGAVFWMWASGVFAMATKYSEAVLGLKFRTRMPDGTLAGGPMLYLQQGARSRLLAWLFALFAGIAAMTTGPLAQTNSIALVLNSEFRIPQWFSGALIAVAAWLVIIGGIKSIARISEKLVPLKVFLYVGGAFYVILAHASAIPQALALIFKCAFSPAAAIGGFAGAMVKDAARLGAARGMYANEAGLGTAGMAYGAARSLSPVRQGLIATVDVFVITFVTCTMTALTVVISGEWSSGAKSTPLVASAFNTSIPVVGGWMVAISSFLFGYSNLIGWAYYGELCFGYIFRSNVLRVYAWIYCGLIFVGSITAVQVVWDYADTMNGLQMIPNVIGLAILAPKVAAETRRFWNSGAEAVKSSGTLP